MRITFSQSSINVSLHRSVICPQCSTTTNTELKPGIAENRDCPSCGYQIPKREQVFTEEGQLAIAARAADPSYQALFQPAQ